MEKKFKVIVEKGIDGYFIAEVPELPGCYSQGKTVKELMENIKEAIKRSCSKCLNSSRFPPKN